MSKIFINYRRDDSAAYAGRIYDRLIGHLGSANIFIDIDYIELGEDFIEVIYERLSSVQVAIILIGKQWLEIKDSMGQRRLDNPEDFVRLEIEVLLKRKIRVIPVLVGDATMPKSSQLPESLAPLVRRHAHEVSDNRFHFDVGKLIISLEKIIAADVSLITSESTKKHNPKVAMSSHTGFSKSAGTPSIVSTLSHKKKIRSLGIIFITIFFLALPASFLRTKEPVTEPLLFEQKNYKRDEGSEKIIEGLEKNVEKITKHIEHLSQKKTNLSAEYAPANHKMSDEERQVLLEKIREEVERLSQEQIRLSIQLDEMHR